MYKLSNIPKKKFTYQDVLKVWPDLDYERLYQLIGEWMEQGLIQPIKKSGLTSFRPPVFHEYKKVIIKPDYSSCLDRIKALHPKLNIGRYLSRPEHYAGQQEAIQKLSEFFWRKGADFNQIMSVNEKSYEIWGDEKLLDSAVGQALLTYNRITLAELGCYRTPEPYFSTIFSWEFRDQVILIIENKDTWYTISKLLKQSPHKQLCKIPIAMTVYGEGNKATRKGGISEFLKDYTSLETMVYYFGDIDVAGIDIYERVQKANQELRIERFLPGYKEMIRKAAGQVMLPTDDTRNLSYPETFLEGFTTAEQQVIRHTLDRHLRIPQEILNYHDYRSLCQ